MAHGSEGPCDDPAREGARQGPGRLAQHKVPLRQLGTCRPGSSLSEVLWHLGAGSLFKVALRGP